MLPWDRAELERARDLLAAGEVRKAMVICGTLGADTMPRRVPRCAWVARLLSGPEPRLDDAKREIDQLLEAERETWIVTTTSPR
jgi:hypothetical protein